MLEKAAGELKIDLASSYVVGDRWEDIELAHRAGARGVLVLTGYGRQELKRLSEHKENNQPPPYVARDLLRATDWILEDFKRWAQSLK
jgi:D-glycero-D-manno-heptose 1,7-bisphosphate phosphatase